MGPAVTTIEVEEDVDGGPPEGSAGGSDSGHYNG
jgi:hypothetical protein